MFENHLGLRENPFVAGHQPRFVYPSREHQEALAHLRFGIENREPFVLITGEVGTGKTTAIYDALHGWGTKAVVALITNSALNRSELLEEIALRFGLALPPGMSKPQAMVLLERHLQAIRERGELAVLLLDEAQNLERDLLEEIRLLSNLESGGQKLMQIFLVGQPELEQKLAGVELRQLRQRITVHYRLNPLSPEETGHYIHHRVAVAGGNGHELFPPETCAAIFTLTHGIPREINTVCGQALINAYVEDSHVVLPEHVMTLARDTTFRSVLDKSTKPGDPKPVDDLLAAEAATVGPRPYVPPPPPPIAVTPPAPPARPAPEPPAPFAIAPALAAPAFEPPAPMAAPAPPRAFQPPAPVPPPPPASVIEAATPPEMSNPNKPPVFSADPEPLPPLPSMEAPEPVAAEESDMQPEASEPNHDADDTPGAEPTPEAPAAPPPSWAPLFDPKSRPEPTPMSEAGAGAEPSHDPIPEGPLEMPAWLDEVIARKQSSTSEPEAPRPQVVSARLPAPELPPPPPPTPLRMSPPPSIAPHPSNTGLEPDFISNRLREKLEAVETRKRTSAAMPWFVAAVVLALVAVAMILMVRFGDQMPWSGKSEKASAALATSAATLPATQAPIASDSSLTARTDAEPTQAAAQTPATRTEPLPAASTPAPAPVSAPTAAPAVAKTTVALKHERPAASTHASAKTAKSGKMYAIVVGTFFDESRAIEVARKAATGGMPSQAMYVMEDGAPMYRAVVGRFGDRAGADRAASKLAESGAVGEARVIALEGSPK